LTAREYKVVRIDACPETEQRMTDLGARGWRLVNVTSGLGVFSRRVGQTSRPDLPRVDPSNCEIEKTLGE